MAIVNVIYPSDDSSFESAINDLKSYVKGFDTILKMTSTETSKITEISNHAFGFDIIISICKSDVSNVGYFLRSGAELQLDSAQFSPINVDNPNTMAKFVIGIVNINDVDTILGVVKDSIKPILSDPSRNEIFRWIRDDIGSWYSLPVSQSIQHIKVVYDKFGFGNDVYLDFASHAYKVSVCNIKGSKEIKWYLFNKNGYVYSTVGFKPIPKANKAMYIQEDLTLAEGWTMIDGKWHLFNNCHFTDNAALIDGIIYGLEQYGKLNEDASLFEVDAKDKFVLHRKQEAMA